MRQGRRGVILVVFCLLAFAHAAFFIGHMRPDREGFWAAPPQSAGGYTWLARNLLRGQYTQEQNVSGPATPDQMRTPGYPLFLALIYLIFGFGDGPVLWTQALLYVAICLGVYALGRRFAGERVALLTAFATALYAPIPKYGGMVWSETLTTFLQLFGVLALVIAVSRASAGVYLGAGVLFGFLALTRPTFVFEAPVLAGALLVVHWRSARLASLGRQLGVFLLAWALVLTPWATFNYVRFGKATPTVARTFGKQLWYGYWVGQFPTGVLLDLEAVVADINAGKHTREEIPNLVRPLGSDLTLMRRFVEEYTWRNHFPDAPRTPEEKIREGMLKDAFYLERAHEHIRGDFWTYLRTQLLFVSFKFWAGEIPVRLTLIGSLPRMLIYAVFLIQVGLVLLALIGGWRARANPLLFVFVVAPLVYLYVFHLPFHVEPRYSIPVKPFLLLLASIGATALWGRSPLLRRSAA